MPRCHVVILLLLAVMLLHAQDAEAAVIGVATISVYQNRAPELSLGDGTAAYVEDQPAVPVAPVAVLVDDSPSFSGGRLTALITTNLSVDDRLEIQHVGNDKGQIGVVGTTVSYAGVAIGTVTGGEGKTPLLVDLAKEASPEAVQALVRAVTFRIASDEPSTSTRTVEMTVGDGQGDSSVSKPASRSVTVTATNDAPVQTVPGDQTTRQNTLLVFSAATRTEMTVSDADAGKGALRTTVNVTRGVLGLNPTGGRLRSKVSGEGTSILTLEGAPVDITADLDGLTFKPEPDMTGNVTLTIVTDDQGNTGAGGSRSVTIGVQITVTPLNSAPRASDDAYRTRPNATLTVPTPGLLANDSDPDAGSVLVVQLVATTAHGSLSLLPDGSFTYTPNAEFVGRDEFRYRVFDGQLASTPATVTLDVLGSTLTVAGATTLEGAAGGSARLDFVVTLDPVETVPVTVRYATADGSAVAFSDYAPVDGVLTINPGQRTALISVNIVGDALPEADEQFTVVLSLPTNATVRVRQATGTIGNDDVASACVPRPGVTSTITPRIGTLRIQVTATQTTGQPPSTLQRLQFGTMQNATVTFNGAPVMSGQTITLPPNTYSIELVVRRAARRQATTVPLTVVDGCGEWTTFVGGGIFADF